MSVTEKKVDFNSFEQEVFRHVCEIGCEIIRQALIQYDLSLDYWRDKKKYRAKDVRKTTFKTVMGEVEINRGYYETIDEDGTKRYVYLLDEALGITGTGFFSELLCEMIAKAACETSYRSAARSISELTGQTISHTAAWNVVQQLGQRLDSREEEAASLAAENEGKGTLETPVLFEEMDGIWLHLQGKDRKNHGKSKEMKVAIAYDGAEKVGKKRYRLTNKVATANFESAKRFRIRKEGTIAAAYNVDEIDMRFVNGDGANWIKESQVDDTVHLQLDPFHCNQAITKYVFDPEARQILLKLLYSKQTDLLLDAIEAYSNSSEDEKERDNFLKLLGYFQSNKDGLIPCHRRGLDIPEPPEGKVYRRMGAMESNIFTIIGNRMKGRRFCWSIDGGNNLARLLCLKTTGKLVETLRNCSTVVLPERYAEDVSRTISAAKIPLREGKGYDGFRHMTVPSSMPWLKELAGMRPLC
jgi:hypothetical protein